MVLLAGALGQALTAPGQTAALSVFIDPLIADLDVSRSAVSAMYLVATLLGASALPLIGRSIDRLGVRLIMTLISIAFGGVLLASAGVVGLLSLALAFTGLRMLGQGALGLAASTAVALAFDRHRGTAIAITTAVGAAGVSLAPVALNEVIAAIDWRATFIVEGMLVLAVVPILAFVGLGIHPRLKRHGRQRETAPTPDDVHEHTKQGRTEHGNAERSEGEADRRARRRRLTATNPVSWTPRQAMRTVMFWAMAAAMTAFSVIGTGLNFHQISLLGEFGLTRTEAAAIFLPQTASVLLFTLAAGPLVDRFPARLLMASTMATLGGAMLLLLVVEPGWRAILYGVVLGSGMGFLRTVETAIMPAYYGVRHLGAIRGIFTGVGIAGSAFGPIVLALGQAAFGSYVPIVLLLLIYPGAVLVGLLLAPTPGVRK